MKLFAMAALVLAGWLAMGAAAQTPIARFIYEDAESAFAQGDYPLALTRLREAEQAFGKINPPILYLRIQSRHELLKAKGEGPVDFNLLDPLRGDVQRYLKDYGNNAVLVDQVREIYRLSRELERYPADRAAYEAQLAAAQRAAEQAQQAEAERQAAERARLSEPGRVFRDCAECPEMVIVPGGKLTVQAFDGPREIEIRPFAISRYELTWEQWVTLLGKTETLPQLRCKSCPVEDRYYSPHGPSSIWGSKDRDAWQLLNAISAKSGFRYHLPSEAQWEWACRGGELHRYCGGDVLEEVAQFKKVGQPVGGKRPNGYGLYDMSGNAYDGTGDSFFMDYAPPPDGGPRFDANINNTRVITRGGRALQRKPMAFEVTTRGNHGVGLRLARPLANGLLGVEMQTTSGAEGARVASARPGSGAERAGIQAGDVIVALDGRPILTNWSLIAYVAQLRAGDQVKVELLRNGERRSIDVVLDPL